MKYRDPLRQILSRTRRHWDNDATSIAVRQAFGKALQCRTAELGAEIYASENRHLTVYHTCKSRPCSSCGYRSTMQWQRERWAALPNGPYKDITFTMPDVLWPIFHDNPHLTAALPALAATTIESEMAARYGLRVGVVAVLHTFNGKLEYNSHVHTMVTGGGLRPSSSTWVPRAYYKRDQLTKVWRKAVIALLRAALRAGQLHANMTTPEMKAL